MQLRQKVHQKCRSDILFFLNCFESNFTIYLLIPLNPKWTLDILSNDSLERGLILNVVKWTPIRYCIDKFRVKGLLIDKLTFILKLRIINRLFSLLRPYQTYSDKTIENLFNLRVYCLCNFSCKSLSRLCKIPLAS